MPRMGFCGGNNAALGNFDNVVAERLRHRVQRQRAVDEPLHVFEAAHCALLVVIDDSEAFARREFRHEFHRELVGVPHPRSDRADRRPIAKESGRWQIRASNPDSKTKGISTPLMVACKDRP